MNKKDLLASLKVEVQTLDFWLEQRWLVPDGSLDEETFSDIDVARARLIQDLKGSLGVNDEGIDVILHLLDQLHGFRRAFEELHAELRAPREG